MNYHIIMQILPDKNKTSNFELSIQFEHDERQLY